MKKDTLQAVVIADDFSTNLTPMHNVLPSILVPVVNIPLLEYLIETLVTCGIKELFLYCSNHIDLLKNYVQKIGQKDLVITLIISDGCRSLGDALRDIDTKGWIRGNFILIRGDAFINANLRKILTVHQNKLQKDKGTAMTMVLRNCGSMHNSMLKDETCIVVSKKANKNLLFYKKLNKDEKKVSLELNWFLENHQIEINTNFLDSHVYFCSPAFLPLFADNFDFQVSTNHTNSLYIFVIKISIITDNGRFHTWCTHERRDSKFKNLLGTIESRRIQSSYYLLESISRFESRYFTQA